MDYAAHSHHHFRSLSKDENGKHHPHPHSHFRKTSKDEKLHSHHFRSNSSDEKDTLPPMDCPVFHHSANPWSEAAAVLASNSASDLLPPKSCPAHDAFATLRIASRNSILALVQANYTASMLSEAHPEFTFPIQTVTVKGDADKITPFAKFSTTTTPDANKSLWTKEIEDRLLEGDVDLIVHSLKDMPTVLPPGCVLGAIMEREDPSDALVVKPGLPYTSLDSLPAGSIVGTSSVRRKAQVMHSYPWLKVEECRGNVDGRLAKLDAPNSKYSCLILATAGLERLGLGARITARLSAAGDLHAVGQGALGIEIRAGDARTLSLVTAIDHPPTRLRCLAERSLLRTLQGGCSAPIGVSSKFESTPTPHYDSQDDEDDEESCPRKQPRAKLYLSATVTAPDGSKEVYASSSARISAAADRDAEKLGVVVAEKLLKGGADVILASIEGCARFALPPPTKGVKA